MYCMYCGTENDDDAKFCKKCRRVLRRAPHENGDAGQQRFDQQRTRRYDSQDAVPKRQKAPSGRTARRTGNDRARKKTKGAKGSGGSKKPAVIGAIAAVVIVFAVVVVAMAGSGSDPNPAPSPDPNPISSGSSSTSADSGTAESPENYGTTPANIANGGYVAYADGITYFIGDSSTSSSLTSYHRYAIGSCEDNFANRQVLYKTKADKMTDSQGNKATYSHYLSSLHVTDDSLVFAEAYNENASDYVYDVVRTDLDGSGKEVLLKGLDPEGSSMDLGSYMWLDQGYIYYLDKGSLWRVPLESAASANDADKQFIAQVDKGEACSVDDGTAFCSSDSGWTVTAYDCNDTSQTTTVYESDWVEGIEDDVASKWSIDTPKAGLIIPEGERIYYGIEQGTFSKGFDACISVKRDGSDGKFEFTGANLSGTNYLAIGMTVHDGETYIDYGDSISGGVFIGNMDMQASSDDDKLRTLYVTDGTDTASDGYIGTWLNVVNGRMYFESKGGNSSIRKIGQEATKAEKYDRSTPWSMKLDGSDLRRGIK